jgi:hypothetical protein
MAADTVTVSPDQPKRLSLDRDHLRREVGKHYPGQFKAALIHHKAVCGRRPVPARVVPAAPVPTELTDRRLPTSSSAVTQSSVVSIASPSPDRYWIRTVAAPRRVCLATCACCHCGGDGSEPTRSPVSAFCPIGHRVDRSMRHWTGLLRTYTTRVRCAPCPQSGCSGLGMRRSPSLSARSCAWPQ